MKKDSMGSLDLLKRLNSNSFPANPKPENGQPENVELKLGLSLNGNFGWDPNRKLDDKKLLRAGSCVTELVNNIPVDDVELSLNVPLSRTCSLPEVELRKRKELQTLRRSEVKRKRVEKMMVKRKQSPPLPLPLKRFSSQGSIGSTGSGCGSSGVSDLDSQPSSGTNRDTRETSERSEVNKVQCNQKTKPDVHCVNNQTMPCVTTKENGPDGKRIQGFLYRYGKGEEVRIVCVCHGSFLTPAEFVKHGGGEDVEHPLRHIVVTSLFS